MRDATTITRRRGIILGTTTLLGGVGALAYTQTEPATALTVSGLTVTDASKTLSPDGQVTAVNLDVSIDYEYDSSHAPDTVTAALFVAPAGGSFDELDTLSLAEPTASDSGTVSLAGDLTATDGFAVSDFDAAEGATSSTDVEIKAVLTLRRDGKRIGVADISDTATVAVSREELTVSANIAGTGSIQINTA